MKRQLVGALCFLFLVFLPVTGIPDLIVRAPAARLDGKEILGRGAHTAK